MTNIPNEAPAMDKGELLLLQTAFKSVETFLLLSSDKNTNYSSPVRFSFSEATEEEISPLNKRSKQILSSNPGVDSDLISQLLSAQDLLQKTATKMEVLEIVLDSQKMSLTSNSLHPRSQFGLVDSTGSNKPSSANEGAARNSESDISINADSDTTDGIFSAIKSEIDMLSLCVSERALKSHPLGYFLDNANKKV